MAQFDQKEITDGEIVLCRQASRAAGDLDRRAFDVDSLVNSVALHHAESLWWPGLRQTLEQVPKPDRYPLH